MVIFALLGAQNFKNVHLFVTFGLDLSLIHISEPTRPLYISYAVFCLKKATSPTS